MFNNYAWALYLYLSDKGKTSEATGVSNKSNVAPYGNEVKFKTVIKLTKSDGGEIVFKQDGERFTSQETLKLQTNMQYTITLEISPALELQ